MSFYEKVKAQLERDEGRKNHLYHDTLNVPTIGIGRNLRRGLSDDEVDYLFNNDYQDHLAEMLEAFPWAEKLDEARKGALLNMAFNLGIAKLSKFERLLGALERGEWEAAATFALQSLWASQVKGRAVRIAEQFRSGQWQ